MSTIGTLKSRLVSAYLQDSWRVGESLRINLGLRWDGQNIIGSDGKVAQTFYDQWQPRLGFTFQPSNSGNNQLFGSVGRFYQDLALTAPSQLYIAGSVFRITDYDHDPRLDPSGGNVIVDIESEIADVRNTGKEPPGMITAAKLLEKFVGNTPWVHLDIAGVEWQKESRPWSGPGPTAFGVRLFVDLALRSLSE